MADDPLNVSEPETSEQPHVSQLTARRMVTRHRLFEAAAEAFREEGLQGASVEAICARAGFTRGAFYSNFESKEQLFLELLEREFAERIETLKEQAAILGPTLRESGPSLTPEGAARFVAEFLLPENETTTWFVLETEFLLLALRDRSLAQLYREFLARYEAEILEPVALIAESAGRRFTIPIEDAFHLLNGAYVRELREAALTGASVSESYDRLSQRLATLMFLITEPST